VTYVCESISCIVSSWKVYTIQEQPDEELQKHVLLLQKYLVDNYENEYSEADEQFKKRLVSKKHVAKLFKPNQAIISEKNTNLQRLVHLANRAFFVASYELCRVYVMPLVRSLHLIDRV
jgi:hypothetical protein